MSIRNKKQGFTLIELLVVVSIIALLTSIVLSSLNDARKKARDTARIRAVKEVQTALQMYFSDNGQYPNTNYGASPLNTILSPKYISTINPEIKYIGITSSNAACGHPLHTCTSYHLGILLESDTNNVLKSDADQGRNLSTYNFNGNSTDCSNTSDTITAPDKCYDLTP